MLTPGPTTRSAHAAPELGERFLDPDIARFRPLARSHPANPLIAREGSNVFPHRPRRRRLRDGPPQIRWHFVHEFILAEL